jgi:energy-coupling factor transport system substrate-specific component
MSGRVIHLLISLPKPVRFLLAGGGAAAINWLVRFPLSWVMPFYMAVLIAAIIGMVVGFTLYRGFVFPGSARPVLLEARDFFAVNLVSSGVVALLAVAFLHLAVQLGADIQIAEAVAHAAAIGLGAVLNYFGHSLITFSTRNSAAQV